MAIELVMPKLGMAMSEGEVVKWLAEDGEVVQAGQPVVQVMTKKITYQVSAPKTGAVQQIAPLKSKWPVNAVLGYILLEGEKPVLVDNKVTLDSVKDEHDDNFVIQGHVLEQPASNEFVLATPMAKRIAKERGVPLSQVNGSGPRGRIQEQDVLAYLEMAPLAKAPEENNHISQLFPFEGMRSAIAERMTESLKQSAQLTLHTEVDVTSLWNTRANYLQTPPSFTAIVAVVVARTLIHYPRLNATIMEDGIHVWPEVNLGIAVALEEGLIVPVIHHAEIISVENMAKEIGRLSEKSRNNQLTVDEVTGATFTLTNLGMYDIDGFTPIINTPEIAILGIGRVSQKPAVRDGAIVPRQFLTLSLTIDHRAIDGAPAAHFLQTLSRHLMFPGLLWMEAV